MNNIIKVCKVHNELTREKVFILSSGYIGCSECRKACKRKYRKRIKEGVKIILPEGIVKICKNCGPLSVDKVKFWTVKGKKRTACKYCNNMSHERAKQKNPNYYLNDSRRRAKIRNDLEKINRKKIREQIHYNENGEVILTNCKVHGGLTKVNTFNIKSSSGLKTRYKCKLCSNEYAKNMKKESRSKLKNNYIAMILSRQLSSFKMNEIPKTLIELKRVSLQLKRIIKEKTNERTA